MDQELAAFQVKVTELGQIQDLTDLVTRFWERFRTCTDVFHHNHSLKCIHPLSCLQTIRGSSGNNICDPPVKLFSDKCSILFRYAFIFFHLFDIFSSEVCYFLNTELPLFTQPEIHTSLLLRKMPRIRNR